MSDVSGLLSTQVAFTLSEAQATLNVIFGPDGERSTRNRSAKVQAASASLGDAFSAR